MGGGGRGGEGRGGGWGLPEASAVGTEEVAASVSN